MTNEQKANKLREWLMENHIEHWESVTVPGTGIIIPIYIPLFRIAIRIGDDQAWYMMVRSFVSPVIIRDDDTEDFVIKKVYNTIKHQKEKLKTHITPSTYAREHRRAYMARRRLKFRKSLIPAVRHCIITKKNTKNC